MDSKTKSERLGFVRIEREGRRELGFVTEGEMR